MTGLVLGRFQPFHKGHLHLIKHALTVTDTVIIAVGSSNKKNTDNPLSYRKRLKMLKMVIEHEGLSDKVLKILPVPDHPNNNVWLNTLLKRTGSFTMQFGNNPWPNGILSDAGFTVVTVPFKQQEVYQGVVIRKLFKEGGNWQERVPAYLVSFIEKELTLPLL